MASIFVASVYEGTSLPTTPRLSGRGGANTIPRWRAVGALVAGATRIFGSQLDPDIVAVSWTWTVKALQHANHTTSQPGWGRTVSIGSHRSGIHKSRGHVRNWAIMRSRLNWITGPGPKSGSAGKSEPRGPENGVSRWRPNSDIYSQKSSFWFNL